MQVFYALIAMMLLAILSLTVQRTNQRMESRMHVNEVVTQAAGVAMDIMEEIGKQPFDAKTDSTKITTFPQVSAVWELTDDGDFGGCVAFHLCEDLDDYDGLVITRNVDGFVYTATISVNYIDITDPDNPVGSKTFAKEVLVEVTNPYLFVGNRSNPVTVPFRRIFSYQKTTGA